MKQSINKEIPLGRQIGHSESYDPSQLFSVPRKEARKGLGIINELPFSGVDIWNAYELSWLDGKGKPCVAAGEILFPCTSENIIESKSLKLYLNSFNLTRFESVEKVRKTITEDLSLKARSDVTVKLFMPEGFARMKISDPSGTCIDTLDLESEINTRKLTPEYLKTSPVAVEEELFSNLLRTNCPVTGQPDWASVMIKYRGNAIDHKGLLRYIISLRRHSGFHENCVELIFMDILKLCKPASLSVYARFTRRGGLDINPGRSNHGELFSNIRLARQ